MKYVQALVSLGLFGWLSFAVATDSVPGGDGGSSKTRALNSAITSATDQFGTMETALGLAMVGLVLAMFFVSRRTDA